MNILILGAGGREHALAWAIKQNPKCAALYVAPGNAGIAAMTTCIDLDILDGNAVAKFAAEHEIELVIIGPEAPLAAGVADICRAAGLTVFGPSKAAAQLESSKSFTKAICDAASAPTAAWAQFSSAAPAKAYIEAKGAPIVIKADGLAAGKGVTVAMSKSEALAAIDDCFSGFHGAAGAEVVIEEFMEGEEASYFLLVDGTDIVAIGTAQDHKRAYDGDKGPNTGGMGAYSPAPVLSDSIAAAAMAEIIRPTMEEMAHRGMPYQGVLYAGLMIKDGKARLVEYNCRFGDPECQVLMMRLGAQALDLIHAAAEGRLDTIKPHWADDHAVSIVMATNGYPGNYEKGSIINGLETIAETSHQAVFHAGTVENDGAIRASGGRVLGITARGDTLKQAQEKAYALTGQIDWPEGFYRKDIGWRAL